MRSRSRGSAGFTLVEMATVVAVIAIGTSIAAMTFNNLKRSERRREIIRTIVGLAAQARVASLALGPVARTPRASLDVTCMGGLEAAFSDTADASNGRVAIAFIPSVNVACGGGTIACCALGEPVPCDVVAWVDTVTRVASAANPWNGDDYVLQCKSMTLGEREGAMLDGPNFAGFPAPIAVSGTNAYFVVLDERGFITPPPAAPMRVAIQAQVGTGSIQKGVLLLASGLACMQGTNTECARAQ